MNVVRFVIYQIDIRCDYRDKEELGSIVSNQSSKIAKLDSERMEYQKKIIEVSISFWWIIILFGS